MAINKNKKTHYTHVAETLDSKPTPAYTTTKGAIYNADSLTFMREHLPANSIDLVVTSPPFGLVRKKDYGNVDADKYVSWFRPFGTEIHRILKSTGSFVIDIGSAWNAGLPTKSLYHYELLIMLCREMGFHLAQEFFWWSPSKLPSPAEWVTVRRIRVKDAVNFVWWLSPTPWPKSSNRRVLTPYSDSMKGLLKTGYRAKLRPSGHEISEKFAVDNGAAIPPNLLAIPNTESNSYYQRYCRENNLPVHPARFPAELPEYFIRMLTDVDDLVLDPFGGSCVTGEVCERLNRRWICSELRDDYIRGGISRFHQRTNDSLQSELLASSKKMSATDSYKIYHPGALWNDKVDSPPKLDSGKKRTPRSE